MAANLPTDAVPPRVIRLTRLKDVALLYAERWGWVAIPAASTAKRPLGPWNEEALPALPSLDALTARWNAQSPNANIAILTGRRSGIVVGDVDPRHGGALETLWERGWPRHTPIARSGGGGWHVYATYPEGGLASLSAYAPGVELKADGALVIAPFSRHPDTKQRYTWLPDHAPWDVAVAALPPDVVAAARAQRPAWRGSAPAATLTAEETTVWRDVGLSTRQVAAYARARYRRAVRSVAPGPSRKHRNEALYLLAAQLYQLGMPASVVRERCAAFCEEVYGDGE